jgi:hypothetical protein
MVAITNKKAALIMDSPFRTCEKNYRAIQTQQDMSRMDMVIVTVEEAGLAFMRVILLYSRCFSSLQSLDGESINSARAGRASRNSRNSIGIRGTKKQNREDRWHRRICRQDRVFPFSED